MNKLTIAQFIEQVQNENMDYALSAEIINDAGVTLCTGEAIHNFFYAGDDNFDGVFIESQVANHIDIMNTMAKVVTPYGANQRKNIKGMMA